MAKDDEKKTKELLDEKRIELKNWLFICVEIKTVKDLSNFGQKRR